MAFQGRRLPQYRGDVDRSLFASSKAKAGKDTASDAVIISRSEILEMQGSAAVLSEADIQRLKETQKMKTAEAAQRRKERMQQLERESNRRVHLTDEDRADITHRDVTLSQARQLLDEELDDVKHMNQMALYAKCVTVRDAQILERDRLRQEAKAEERRLDAEMSALRLKQQQDADSRDASRTKDSRAGAKVIIQQIQEREAERIRQEELRRQEALLMLQRVKEAEDKAEQDRLNKLAAGRRLLEEVKHANTEQARQKLLRKQEEVEEDARIADYIRAKEAREMELEAAQSRIKQDKEREVAKMRSLQEKAKDRQAQIDELRARRYQEQRDRQQREQELKAAEKAARFKAEMQESREQQQIERARRMADQVVQDRAELESILEWQRKKDADDAERAAVLRRGRERQREVLQQQIYEREHARAEDRRKFVEDGGDYATQLEKDRAKLLRIKQQKLAELEAAGVPEKYRAELARKKVLVASIH